MATTARRICVTGATGKAGRAVVRELREHGYQVVATDARVSGDDVRAGVLRADLRDYGQATEALRGADAVVHLANIPAPGLSTPAVTFNDNVAMNFNVFHAAAALGLSRGGWASSETRLGLPFGGAPERFPPRSWPRGTCGATSTSATWPPPAVSAWKRTSPAARTSSSRPPTRSWTAPRARFWPRSSRMPRSAARSARSARCWRSTGPSRSS